MKKFTFLLIVLIGCLAMTSKSYSAKDTLPPDPRWNQDCKGIVDGYVEDLPRTYERTFLKSIILDSTKSFNFILSCEEFLPGERHIVKWTANVIDRSIDAQACIIFSDMAGNDTTILIEYVSCKFTLRPNLDFGKLGLYETKKMNCRIINKNKEASEIIYGLAFKDNHQGFEIVNIEFPNYIGAGDSLEFQIRFTSDKTGNFKDSIRIFGCCSGCIDCSNGFSVQVKAKVIAPEIVISSYNYGNVDINKVKQGTMTIFNKSDVELVINGCRLPQNPTVFITELPEISEEHPLILKPNELLSFETSFIPQEEKEYLDSIIFISNTTKDGKIDSVAVLRGRGISYPVIDVSDAFFGNVFYNSNSRKTIEVKNTGYKDLIISDYYKQQSSMFTNMFDREINPDNPLTLKPEESWNFDVEFCSPTETGCIYTNYIIFHSNAAKGDSTAYFKVDSVLLGIDEQINGNEIAIFPNPADDFLSINFEDISWKPEFIKLYNSYGNVVYENKNIISDNLKISTSELASGIYFLQLGNEIVRKVVIVH
ncbi:MAG: T9SS type A sorting domain-containing protein [Ignavibacteriae bacterium]|nr:T9SS type A sorting domain-containing protein [Ignavibacteriota bacterium]